MTKLLYTDHYFNVAKNMTNDGNDSYNFIQNCSESLV